MMRRHQEDASPNKLLFQELYHDSHPDRSIRQIQKGTVVASLARFDDNHQEDGKKDDPVFAISHQRERERD
eukprot:scaffold20931_cov76-Amphora_coffeaeformis.AAC.1